MVNFIRSTIFLLCFFTLHPTNGFMIPSSSPPTIVSSKSNNNNKCTFHSKCKIKKPLSLYLSYYQNNNDALYNNRRPRDNNRINNHSSSSSSSSVLFQPRRRTISMKQGPRSISSRRSRMLGTNISMLKGTVSSDNNENPQNGNIFHTIYKMTLSKLFRFLVRTCNIIQQKKEIQIGIF